MYQSVALGQTLYVCTYLSTTTLWSSKKSEISGTTATTVFAYLYTILSHIKNFHIGIFSHHVYLCKISMHIYSEIYVYVPRGTYFFVKIFNFFGELREETVFLVVF